MKKNNYFIFVMLTVMLAFGFVLTGCATDSDSVVEVPKTIEITGFNEVTNTDDGIECVIFKSLDGPKIARIWIRSYTDSFLHLPLIDMDTSASGTHPENGEQSWTGTGDYLIMINFEDGSYYYYSNNGTDPTPFYIKDATTTLDWAEFKFVQDKE